MPYRYLPSATAAVVTASAVVVITAARGKRAVKTANYTVGRAGKSLCETSYDTVASAITAIVIVIAVVTATAAVSYCSVCAAAVIVVEIVFVLTAAGAVILISDGTSAAADAVITV